MNELLLLAKWIVIVICVVLFIDALIGYIIPTIYYQFEDYKIYNTPMILKLAYWNSETSFGCSKLIEPYMFFWGGSCSSIALSYAIKKIKILSIISFLTAILLTEIPFLYL